MLGAFIMPFFLISLVIGLMGLSLFTYLSIKSIYIKYLATKFSIYAGTDLIKFSELNLHPSVLNYFGLALFLLGGIFTYIGLSIVKEKELRDKNIPVLFVYFIIYLSLYPLILITSIYKIIRGNYSWR